MKNESMLIKGSISGVLFKIFSECSFGEAVDVAALAGQDDGIFEMDSGENGVALLELWGFEQFPGVCLALLAVHDA